MPVGCTGAAQAGTAVQHEGPRRVQLLVTLKQRRGAPVCASARCVDIKQTVAAVLRKESCLRLTNVNPPIRQALR